MNPLSIYLLTVLSAIAPRVPASRLESIAADVAAVTLAEPRAFDGDSSGQRTALLLLSIARWETGGSWAAWVDDGRCNDPAWRAAHAALMKGGDCDGGAAYGLWQVHAPGDDPAVGRTYVADRRVGIRAALAVARASLESGRGLCGYSGEQPPHCPKAALRLETARRWVTEFPFDQTPPAPAPNH
jgi:hypothetical protein